MIIDKYNDTYEVNVDKYHEGYEAALIELKKLQQKYNEKLCSSFDFSEGFFDAINDYSGDE